MRRRRIKDVPKQDRPREKLLSRGVDALSNVELLALLLNKGSRKKDVLALAEDILKVLEKDPENVKVEDLTKIEGVGVVRAVQVVAALALSRRLLVREGTRITSAQQIFHMNMDIARKKQECVALITVDGAGAFIRRRILASGTADGVLVHPREVFFGAIQDGASGFFVVHNHPSGDLTPSQEDIALTRRLEEASRIMGIAFLDHIIVSRRGFFSFREKGLMDGNPCGKNG